MSSITIIGTGNMARTIGALAVAGGNTVEVIGRDKSKAADLAKELGGSTTTGEFAAVPAGDIVNVALLYAGVVPVIAQYGKALAGKVIVDICNPFNSAVDGLAVPDGASIAQEVAKVAPASASVAEFIETLKLRPLDVGGLNMARYLEGMGLVAVGVAQHGVGNLDFALGVTVPGPQVSR